MFNLQNLLPSYYKGIRETDVLMDVENQLFNELQNHVTRVMNNQFILTCDVVMLYQWEQMLGIVPDTLLESLEFRRMRILNRVNSRSPFTYWFYRQALESLFGRDGASLEVDHNNYLLKIDIHSFDYNAYNEFINHLRITMPANLMLNIRLTHQLASTTAYHGAATIGGEVTEIRPYLITDVESSGPVFTGAAMISGEVVSLGPEIITEVSSEGAFFNGMAMISGEVVTIYPYFVSELSAPGNQWNGIATISGEVVEIYPRGES